MERNGGDAEAVEHLLDVPLNKASAKEIMSRVGGGTNGIDGFALLSSVDSAYTMKHHSAALLLASKMKANVLRKIRERAEAAREKVQESHAHLADNPEGVGDRTDIGSKPTRPGNLSSKTTPETPAGQEMPVAFDGASSTTEGLRGPSGKRKPTGDLPSVSRSVPSSNPIVQEAKDNFGEEHEDSLL